MSEEGSKAQSDRAKDPRDKKKSGWFHMGQGFAKCALG